MLALAGCFNWSTQPQLWAQTSLLIWIFFNWCGALCSLTDPFLWLLLLWLLLHPAPTALPPQMIVSTALLCVCLSVRQQWFGSLLYVAVIPPVDAQHSPCPSSQPHLTELSHLSCISSSLLFLSNTVSRLRRQKHGALLTASDRFPQQFPPPTWTLSSNRKWNSCLAPGVALSFLVHCVLLFRLWWGDSDLLVARSLVSCSCSKLLPPLQLSLPVPPVLHYPLWVYCLHLIYLNPAVFSQETVQHRAVCLCRPTLLVCPGLISCSLVTLMVLNYGTENHHWFELIIMTEDAFNVPWKKNPLHALYSL